MTPQEPDKTPPQGKQTPETRRWPESAVVELVAVVERLVPYLRLGGVEERDGEWEAWRLAEDALRLYKPAVANQPKMSPPVAVLPRIPFDEVLASADPVAALRDAVALELAQNVDREDMYDVLDEVRLRLREEGRDADEDVVADVMDFLVGFCSPQARL